MKISAILLIFLMFLALASAYSLEKIVNRPVIEVRDYKCVDSDGNVSFKESLFIQGETILKRNGRIISDKKDVCIGKKRVKEYYCMFNARIGSVVAECGVNSSCVEGRCIEKNIFVNISSNNNSLANNSGNGSSVNNGTEILTSGTSCDELTNNIYNELTKINYCSSDNDCLFGLPSNIGPAEIIYGCGIFYNKNADLSVLRESDKAHYDMGCLPRRAVTSCLGSSSYDVKCISNKCVQKPKQVQAVSTVLSCNSCLSEGNNYLCTFTQDNTKVCSPSMQGNAQCVLCN